MKLGNHSYHTLQTPRLAVRFNTIWKKLREDAKSWQNYYFSMVQCYRKKDEDAVELQLMFQLGVAVSRSWTDHRHSEPLKGLQCWDVLGRAYVGPHPGVFPPQLTSLSKDLQVGIRGPVQQRTGKYKWLQKSTWKFGGLPPQILQCHCRIKMEAELTSLKLVKKFPDILFPPIHCHQPTHIHCMTDNLKPAKVALCWGFNTWEQSQAWLALQGKAVEVDHKGPM